MADKKLPLSYKEALHRTDINMRLMLEMVLYGTIVSCNNYQQERVLKYGRENTFLLHLSRESMRVALDNCSSSGPQAGDCEILRNLIIHEAIISIFDETQVDDYEESPKAAQKAVGNAGNAVLAR